MTLAQNFQADDHGNSQGRMVADVIAKGPGPGREAPQACDLRCSVELEGIEPSTSSMPWRRSAN